VKSYIEGHKSVGATLGRKNIICDKSGGGKGSTKLVLDHKENVPTRREWGETNFKFPGPRLKVLRVESSHADMDGGPKKEKKKTNKKKKKTRGESSLSKSGEASTEISEPAKKTWKRKELQGQQHQSGPGKHRERGGS